MQRMAIEEFRGVRVIGLEKEKRKEVIGLEKEM